MSGVRKSEIRNLKLETQLLLALSVCTLLFVGCNGERVRKPKVDRIRTTPTEEKKARLLKDLDRKFENPDAHAALGRLYQTDGLWAEAEYYYKTALSFDPVHRDAQAGRVKVLLDSGDTQMAELMADEYIQQAAVSAEGSLLLGLAFQNHELDEYALMCYRQALNLAPNSAKINRQIGYYYLSKNEKGRAQDYLSRSFQLDPNQPEVARELGRLGVAVRIPRKTVKKTKKLDKIVEQSDKNVAP